jgi:hypothetical protein
MEAATTNQNQDGGAAEQAQEKINEVADQAREQAGTLAAQAQDRARSELDRRSTEAGERVSATADDVRSVSQELRNQGKDGPAKIAEQAADRVERAGTYLRDSDADRMLRDAEDFGRRQPWAVLAGSVVAGLAAARFLKASSDRRYATSAGANGAGNGAGPAR